MTDRESFQQYVWTDEQSSTNRLIPLMIVSLRGKAYEQTRTDGHG